MFTLLIFISSLLVAGCAAYFSVQGLATLYSGFFISVCIMAGSLELGKLVAASYLHRYWNKTSFLLKTYLLIAILTLMTITSLGIFGFLTSAYQKSHVKIEILETQRQSLLMEKSYTQNEIDNFTKRIETLNGIRLIQEKRVEDAGNYKVPREQAYEAIDKANKEIEESKNKISELNTIVKNLDIKLLNLKEEESKSSDIGTLKFVAELFNTDIEKIVKWFTIAIVLVFDPLAVCLVLAYSNIIKNKQNKIVLQEEEKQFGDVETPNPKRFNRILKPFKMKYKDNKVV